MAVLMGETKGESYMQKDKANKEKAILIAKEIRLLLMKTAKAERMQEIYRKN